MAVAVALTLALTLTPALTLALTLTLTPALVLAVTLALPGLKEMFSSRLGTPVLNLDFLLDEVVQRQKPIDWEGFAARQEP